MARSAYSAFELACSVRGLLALTRFREQQYDCQLPRALFLMSPVQQIRQFQVLRRALYLLALATAAGCSGADLAAPGSTNVVAIAPSPGNGIRYVERVDFSVDCVGSDDDETDDIRVEGSLSLTEDQRVAELDAWGTDLELPPG